MKRLTSYLPSKRDILFWWQRIARGWDDSETWSMDSSLAKIILPQLHLFKGYQYLQEMQGFYPNLPENMSINDWNKIIDQMIWSFQWFSNGKQYTYDYVTEANDANKAYDGVELFAKYYKYLWSTRLLTSSRNVWSTYYVSNNPIFVSTKQEIAQSILPRLERLTEIRVGHPYQLSNEEWENILSEIVWGFKWFAKEDLETGINDRNRANAAMKLFGRFYGNLWW
jgi:hypothetical protein